MLIEDQQWYYLTQSQGDSKLFSKPISPKMNLKVQLELTYFEDIVQHYYHYAIEVWPCQAGKNSAFSDSKLE